MQLEILCYELDSVGSSSIRLSFLVNLWLVVSYWFQK